MRKVTIIFIILALVLSLTVPAFAADQTRETIVTLTFEVAEPKYTVEIPASIELDLDEAVYLPVTVNGAETLSGRTVVIKIADAVNGKVSYYSGYSDDCFIVENITATGSYYKTIGYSITNPETYSGVANISGISDWKACEFTEDGTKNLDFLVMQDNFDPNLVLPNSKYTGWVTFGISLEW